VRNRLNRLSYFESDAGLLEPGHAAGPRKTKQPFSRGPSTGRALVKMGSSGESGRGPSPGSFWVCGAAGAGSSSVESESSSGTARTISVGTTLLP